MIVVIYHKVEEVFSFTTCAVVEDCEVEDTAAVCLRLRSGMIGVVSFNWARSAEGFYEVLRIMGSEGEITVTDGIEIRLASERRFGDRELHMLNSDEEAGDLPEEQFLGQLRHFIDCVHSGERPLTDGRTARDTVAVIEAAYRSAETGKVVKVDY